MHIYPELSLNNETIAELNNNWEKYQKEVENWKIKYDTLDSKISSYKSKIHQLSLDKIDLRQKLNFQK